MVVAGGKHDSLNASCPSDDEDSSGKSVSSTGQMDDVHRLNTPDARRRSRRPDQFGLQPVESNGSSPILAELRTNIIVSDEFSIILDLTQHLAQRYSRQVRDIVVRVDHSVCLAFGGTWDPCYMLTISGPASQMGPMTNRRNAALTQTFTGDLLTVPPDRGLITFQPIDDHKFAVNGSTIQAELGRQKMGNKSEAVRYAIKQAARQSMPSLPLKSPAREYSDTAWLPTAPPAVPQMSCRHAPDAKRGTPHTVPPLPPNRLYAAENGLRMNGLSKLDFQGRSLAATGSNKVEPSRQSQIYLQQQQSRPTTAKSTGSRAPQAAPLQRGRPLSGPPVKGVALPPTQNMARSALKGSRSENLAALGMGKNNSEPNVGARVRERGGGLEGQKEKDKLIALEKERQRLRQREIDEEKERNLTAMPVFPLPPPPEPEEVKARDGKSKRKSFIQVIKKITA
ncbi:hypothetical protein K470DRAFT_258173 [Piedraia hortae CBS 480.64]|uniref:L-dopachrome isomerase n=1 Tax=Piedraia hortae CBS 480.64 TaxID=1314780 RepID=A0A6A7BXW0_9PEZI|nr:hypothetical protein K470DRAFT_258173 [Piedraia hortae CBS 480.64]